MSSSKGTSKNQKTNRVGKKQQATLVISYVQNRFGFVRPVKHWEQPSQ